MMFELLNNPAFTGLVGTFIGAVASLVGVVYTEHHKTRIVKDDRKYEREKAESAGKKGIYVKFLNLTYQYHRRYGEKGVSNILSNYETNMYSVLSELDLIVSSEVTEACRCFCTEVLSGTMNEDDFRSQYNAVAELFRNDIKSREG